MLNSRRFSDREPHAGRMLGIGDWCTVDQPLIDEFAHGTGEHNWIHVEVERAA